MRDFVHINARVVGKLLMITIATLLDKNGLKENYLGNRRGNCIKGDFVNNNKNASSPLIRFNPLNIDVHISLRVLSNSVFLND